MCPGRSSPGRRSSFVLTELSRGPNSQPPAVAVAHLPEEYGATDASSGHGWRRSRGLVYAFLHGRALGKSRIRYKRKNRTPTPQSNPSWQAEPHHTYTHASAEGRSPYWSTRCGLRLKGVLWVLRVHRVTGAGRHDICRVTSTMVLMEAGMVMECS